MAPERHEDSASKIASNHRDRGPLGPGTRRDDGVFVLPTAPCGAWETLTNNEREWLEYIRIISCGSDPRVTPSRVRALRTLLDAG